MKKEKNKRTPKLSFDIETMRTIRKIFCDNKSDNDHVGWLRAFVMYLLIAHWQVVTNGVGYGKYRKTDVYKYFEEELGETRPHIVIGALIRAGLVVWGTGKYNGKRIVCLQSTYLNEKMRNGKTNTEQAENAIEKAESSAKGDAKMGEYYQYGWRWYRDNNGDSHKVPNDAPKRPTTTALWDGEQWREPEPVKQKQSTPFEYNEPKMSIGIFCRCGSFYYVDKNGDEHWIPDGAAYNRPSIEYVYDFEVCEWRLPEDLTEHDTEF